MELGEMIRKIVRSIAREHTFQEKVRETYVDDAVQAIVKIVDDEYNPILKKDGEVINRYIDRCKALEEELARLRSALREI